MSRISLIPSGLRILFVECVKSLEGSKANVFSEITFSTSETRKASFPTDISRFFHCWKFYTSDLPTTIKDIREACEEVIKGAEDALERNVSVFSFVMKELPLHRVKLGRKKKKNNSDGDDNELADIELDGGEFDDEEIVEDQSEENGDPEEEVPDTQVETMDGNVRTISGSKVDQRRFQVHIALSFFASFFGYCVKYNKKKSNEFSFWKRKDFDDLLKSPRQLNLLLEKRQESVRRSISEVGEMERKEKDEQKRLLRKRKRKEESEPSESDFSESGESNHLQDSEKDLDVDTSSTSKSNLAKFFDHDLFNNFHKRSKI